MKSSCIVSTFATRDSYIVAAVLASALFAIAAVAVPPSLERGKVLFNGTALAGNGKSCVDCHPNGKGLERTSDYDEDELADIVNQCIRKPLDGKGLDPTSVDMKSLIIYIRSRAASGNGR